MGLHQGSHLRLLHFTKLIKRLDHEGAWRDIGRLQQLKIAVLYALTIATNHIHLSHLFLFPPTVESHSSRWAIYLPLPDDRLMYSSTTPAGAHTDLFHHALFAVRIAIERADHVRIEPYLSIYTPHSLWVKR